MFFNKDQRTEKNAQILNHVSSVESSMEENEGSQAPPRRFKSEVFEKVSIWRKLIYKFYYFLNKIRTEAIFKSTLSLYNMVLFKNKKVLRSKVLHMKDFILGDFESIGRNLAKLRDNYWKFMGQNPMDEYIQSRKKGGSRSFEEKEGGKNSFISRQAKKYESQKVQQKLQEMGLNDPIDETGRILNPGAAILIAEIYSIGTKIIDKEREKLVTNSSDKMKNFSALEIMTDDDNFFYNLDVTSIINTDGFTVIKFRVILKLISQIVISQWEYIAYSTFFIVQLVSGGLIMSLLPAMVISLALIEECKPRLLFWKVVFIIICFNICAKVTIRSYFDLKNVGAEIPESEEEDLNYPSNFFIGLASIFLGDLVSVYPDLFVLIIIVFEVGLLDMQGLKDKSVVDYENINDAYIRVSP